MTIVLDNDVETLNELFEDFNIPCDYRNQRWCDDGPAEWIAHGKCPKCDQIKSYLICQVCYDFLHSSKGSAVCWKCHAKPLKWLDVFYLFERISN